MAMAMDKKSRPRVFQLIGIRRCGSHALRLRLNLNQKFYAPYPLHPVDIVSKIPSYGDLEDDVNWFKLVTDLCSFAGSALVKWKMAFDPVILVKQMEGKPRNVHAVLYEMLQQEGEAHGADVVMEKSLDNVLYAEELMKICPDLKFVNIVRDPRAQISSINSAVIHEFDTLLNAQLLDRSYQLAQDLSERYPEKVLTIRFEDFVHYEAETLKKMCDFMQIQYDAEMVNVLSSLDAKELAERSALWENNYNRPLPEKFDAYKKRLTEEDIRIIEGVCGKWIESYGYKLAFPANPNFTVSDDMVSKARGLSAAKKDGYWKALKQKDHQDWLVRKARARVIENMNDW